MNQHIIVLNLTADKLDSSFSMSAKSQGASISIGWKDGAPANISNPANSIIVKEVSIPAISQLIAEHLEGYALSQIMTLEFIVVGGCDEIKRWLAYLCGRWNITLTFWYEKSPQYFINQTIRPGQEDSIFNIVAKS